MNAADLARLELAKRAFKATQPGDAEVQTGVRRARLSLSRPKRRRNWFSKGLVFVVLAVGSLAYAKPHALGEIVEQVLPREGAEPGKRLASVEAALSELPELAAVLRRDATTQRAAVLVASAASGASAASPASAASAASPTEVEADSAGVQVTQAVSTASSAKAAARAPAPKKALQLGNGSAALGRPAIATDAADAADAATDAVTGWGKVGQALARGDENQALAALSSLSQSDDDGTRDKADLGRAQLLMARGDTAKACTLARSLTHRRAGTRIERQAQQLLKSCAR